MPKATFLLRKASELVREKRFHDAVEVYLQATETDPGDSRAWFGLGVCLYRIGNLDVARIALERARQMGYPRAEEALARVSAAEQRRSSEGTGAKATVAPAEAEKRAAQRPTAVKAPPPRPTVRPEHEKIDLDRYLRVMLVENKEADKRAIIEAVEGTIKHCEVVSVPYGVSTSETMSGTVHYDVAVLDWDMAPDAAAGLIQILKIKRPTLLIICLTEEWDPETAVEILEAGADYHLVKAPHFASALPLIMAQWTRRDSAVAQHSTQADRRHAERWPSALDALGEALILVDADFTIMQANRSAMKAFRRGEEEFVGRSYSEVFYNEDEPPQNCPILRALQDGEAADGTVRAERLDTSFSIQAWPVFSYAGKVSGAIALLRQPGAAAQEAASSELRSREQLYRSLTERANAGIALVTPDGTLGYVNRALCTMLDQTEDELIGQPVESIFSVADQESLRECMEAAVEKGTSGDRLNLQRSDGSALPVEARMARIATGEESSLVLTLVGVGELERAEQELWAQSRKMAGILDVGMDKLQCGVAVLDQSGNVTWANGVVAELLGADKEELLGRDYLTLIEDRLCPHLQGGAAFLQSLRSAHRSGQELQELSLRIAGDAEPLIYWSTPVPAGPASVGRIEHFYPAAPQAEPAGALQAGQMSLREVASAMREMLFAADAEGRITWCNPAAAPVTGHSEQELVGMPLAALVPESERAAMEELVRDVLAGRCHVHRRELLFTRPDGTRFWGELTLLPVSQKPGQEAQSLEGILCDVTAAKINEAIRAILQGEQPPAGAPQQRTASAAPTQLDWSA